jgi:hypothetical protein
MPRNQRREVQFVIPFRRSDMNREHLSLEQQSMLDPNVDVWTVRVEITVELNLI